MMQCPRCGLELEAITPEARRHVYRTPYDHVQRVLMHGRWADAERQWLADQLARGGVVLGRTPPARPVEDAGHL